MDPELHAALIRLDEEAAVAALLRFKASGGTRAAAEEYLAGLRATGLAEAVEDFVLDITDRVVGWCQADRRLWPDGEGDAR